MSLSKGHVLEELRNTERGPMSQKKSKKRSDKESPSQQKAKIQKRKKQQQSHGAETRNALYFERANTPTLQNWRQPEGPEVEVMDKDVILECGWGRLIFAHTFQNLDLLVDEIKKEEEGRRDIAFYIRDPHVILSKAPLELFLDPSHTYRLWFENYRVGTERPKNFVVRNLRSYEDAEHINAIYRKRQMMPPTADFIWEQRGSRIFTQLVAEDQSSGQIIGTVMGVDHVHAFSDPENGSSLWALAVDPQAPYPRVGEWLVRHLSETFMARGRSFMDLSVLHNNEQAIRLYKKLHFQRVPVFCVKKKNPYNENLFAAGEPESKLNPYAKIIIKEARKRGINVELLDDGSHYFRLSFGGMSVICWESLTELTSAIAMSRCQDKEVSRSIAAHAGLIVPDQMAEGSSQDQLEFLESHQRVVVKPADGEQGRGITVDVQSNKELKVAIEAAKKVSNKVLLEEFVEGNDLRIIIIEDKLVAAAVRKPPYIVGTGSLSIETLIEKLSRRRSGATGGESQIPIDGETLRCVRQAGYELQDVLPHGESFAVRKTANLHTGGTIHDVTEQLHPKLSEAAIRLAQAIRIPVVGIDFIVNDVTEPDYYFIEANERPGLANHEPQPTAEKFIDLLFPLSK